MGITPIPISSFPPAQPFNVITPFTYRTGLTYIEYLEELKKYVHEDLVGFINLNLNTFTEGFDTRVQELVETVNAALDAAALLFDGAITENNADVAASIAANAAYVNAQVQSIINASITVTDPIMRAVAANASSNFAIEAKARRSAENDGYTARDIATGALTRPALKAALDTLAAELLNATTSAIKTAIKALSDANTATDVGAPTSLTRAAIRALVATDMNTVDSIVRYSFNTAFGAELLKAQPKPIAVMIGTSNAVPTTLWPQKLADERGWTLKNYSIGGGSFTGTGSGIFDAQIDNAVNDISFNKADVKFFILADTGNDIRAQVSIADRIDYVLNKARVNYPNARIIVIPALWGQGGLNTNAAVKYNVRRVYQQLVEVGMKYNAEVIPNTWLWHWDTAAWMLPGEVHYTAAGYDRVYQQMDKYLSGGNTDIDLGQTIMTIPLSSSSGSVNLTASREGNDVEVYGQFDLFASIPADTSLATLPIGMRPLKADNYTPGLAVGKDRVPRAISIYGASGLIRAFDGFPLSESPYMVSAKFPIF